MFMDGIKYFYIHISIDCNFIKMPILAKILLLNCRKITADLYLKTLKTFAVKSF